MKTPIQKHFERKEKRRLIREIEENSRLYELTLNDEYRISLIYLHKEYESKFGKWYSK